MQALDENLRPIGEALQAAFKDVPSKAKQMLDDGAKAVRVTTADNKHTYIRYKDFNEKIASLQRKYQPHQGTKEMERRCKQLARTA